MPGAPRIDNVKPAAALPGGEVSIVGAGFGGRNHARPVVHFGQAEASIAVSYTHLDVYKRQDYKLTREALADTLGRRLVRDDEILRTIQELSLIHI